VSTIYSISAGDIKYEALEPEEDTRIHTVLGYKTGKCLYLYPAGSVQGQGKSN
jgi:hypothetical protein